MWQPKTGHPEPGAARGLVFWTPASSFPHRRDNRPSTQGSKSRGAEAPDSGTAEHWPLQRCLNRCGACHWVTGGSKKNGTHYKCCCWTGKQELTIHEAVD